jgi:multidrug efflux pump subunit AcrA (membrane-fusion protein)
MKKNTIIGLIVVVVLIVLGVIAIKTVQHKNNSAPVAKIYSLVVKTMRPEYKDVTLTLPYIALVQNDEDVIISSKIGARINFMKPIGTPVSKGQVLVRLDNTTIQSGIESIKAQLMAAKTGLRNMTATHKRTLELLAVKGASIEQSQMEESQIAELNAKVESMQQSLNDANNNASYATIKAPTSGMISKTMLNPGDMAMPGQPIAVISSTNGSYLKLSVPSDLKVYGAIKNGKTYPTVSLNSTFNSLAEYKVMAGNIGLMTGERVDLDVIVFSGKAVKVPFDAILNREGKNYVFVKDNDKAIPTEVNVLQSGEDGIVISNQEIAGKDIVVEKQDVLLDILTGVSLKSKEE